MYTHLAQYFSACWKHWDIPVPNLLFEKKENERNHSANTGWWGPAKGVPFLIFVATDIPFNAIVPASIKKMQDALQMRIKALFRALHLIPLKLDTPSSLPSVEVRSLFFLPSTSQPIIHIIPHFQPSQPDDSPFPLSLDAYLEECNRPQDPSEQLYHEYSDKLLRNFVAIWLKTATTRHPLHHNSGYGRKNEKSIPLPTGIQFASAAVCLLSFLFQQPLTENEVDFRKIITTQFPSTKGMIQQIEVILRKKIKDIVEIEHVFSKSHSMEIMQKCNEAYLQDSPPYYTAKYHEWKRNNVMRMYRSLARGPCMEEFAARLERECDLIWKQGRQSCEHISLTGRPCRLKIGHETEEKQPSSRDERVMVYDMGKHNSGFSLFHACDCGKSQRIRDDPFDLDEANVKFYQKFNCCLTPGRAALDLAASIYGCQQTLVLNTDEIPYHDAALLYLGSSSLYKNNVGLDKMEGFMSNTHFLIPWSMTTLNEVKLIKQQQQQQEKDETVNKDPSTLGDTTEWPVLGKALPSPAPPKPVVASAISLEAFPALGSNPTPSSTQPKQLFDTRRKRNQRTRDRMQGLVRGYIGAEYECPHGHRFLSCGEGRVCKLGHAGHPKEHGNHFVHQDLSLHILCPCSNNNTEVTAQLLRIYVVTPDDAVSISIEPKINLYQHTTVDLDIKDALLFGPNSMYCLRLPFIYRDAQGKPIQFPLDAQSRLKSGYLQKDYIKFHFKSSSKWV
ncbi:hypothetical protein EDC96DRAFT_554717 [Choanephora cucurbitarum]|nr:hypothetical protein EDC96DRAFT_554717 [Choanephora cucurbitarum]